MVLLLFFIVPVLVGAYTYLKKSYTASIAAENAYQILKSNLNKHRSEASPGTPYLEGDDGSQLIVMGDHLAIDLIYALKENDQSSTITYMPCTDLCFHFGASAIDPKDQADCVRQSVKYITQKIWHQADAVFLHDQWAVENFGSLKEFLKALRLKTEAPIFVFGPRFSFTKPVKEVQKAMVKIDSMERPSRILEYTDVREKMAFDQRINEFFMQSKLGMIGIHYISLLDEEAVEKLSIPHRVESYYYDQSYLNKNGAAALGSWLKSVHPHLFQVSNAYRH